MLLNAAACIAVGVVVFTGSDASCAGAQNPAACTSASVFYGIVMALGASALGLFSSINAGLVSLTMGATPPKDPMSQLLGG